MSDGPVPVKILHLEDNPLDAVLVRETLVGGGIPADITTVDSREAFEAAVAEGNFDLIIADFNLPSFDGNQALTIYLRSVSRPPFIFVSGSMGEDTAVDCLLRGATDYVLKGNLSRLAPSVRRALNEAREKEELWVAEEKKSEAVAKLLESEEKYRRLVDGLRDVVFSLSKDGTISSLNPAFERITGWRTDDWLGRNFTDLLHPDDRMYAVRTLRDVSEGKNSGVNEYRIKTQSGRYVVAEISTTGDLVLGSLEGFLGVARDMTAQNILREQSRQSQRLESLGTLASGIAHDFNNILAIILSYADSIKENLAGGDGFAAQVEPIINAVERGATLVKQILAFSRSGETNPGFVPLNRMVKDLAKMLNETFPRSISIETDLTAQEPVLNIDGGQLYQAVLNLCVNSRDAILSRIEKEPGTQGIMKIGTNTIDADSLGDRFESRSSRVYATISVADNGTGMGKETVRRAFEPFFTTKDYQIGTGLGLSVVYGTVKSNSGFVDIQSTEGEGTAITLYLPLDPAASQSPLRRPSGISHGVRGEGQLILLVEDEQLLTKILDSALKEEGYKTLTAGDGVAALELFRAHVAEIALVVSDNGLPLMDGISLFQRLKELKPSVNVILTSGYMEQGLKDELLEAGLKDFVEKPYKVDTIMDSVKRALDNG